MSLGAGEIFSSKDDRSSMERTKKIFYGSSLMQYLAELSQIVNEKLEEFSNAVVDLFGKKNHQQSDKIRDAHLELVHHDEMKWSRRRSSDERIASLDNIPIGGENISVKSVQVTDSIDTFDDEKKSSFFDFSDVTKINDKTFLDGLKLGIGLAFLSMALNGFTDHLLFNIPSSMLMWQLGALSAAINSIRN